MTMLLLLNSGACHREKWNIGACHREKCVNICSKWLTGLFLSGIIRKIVLIIDCLELVKVVV